VVDLVSAVSRSASVHSARNIVRAIDWIVSASSITVTVVFSARVGISTHSVVWNTVASSATYITEVGSARHAVVTNGIVWSKRTGSSGRVAVINCARNIIITVSWCRCVASIGISNDRVASVGYALVGVGTSRANGVVSRV